MCSQKVLLTGFKGKNNSSSILVQSISENYRLLTNSFEGLKKDIEEIDEGFDFLIMFGCDKNLKDSVQIERFAEKNGEKMEQEFVLNDADEKFYGVENPENVISCTPAHTFFTDALNDTHRWQVTMALDKSDDIKAALDAMLSEMASSSVKYELNGNGDKNKTLTFRKSEDELQFSITVKFRRNNKNATSELIYAYKMEKSDGQITLTYLGARNSAAESFLSTFASVGTFLESLNGTYTAAGIQNSYSLRELKLTSTNDTNHWFDIQYAN